MTTTVIITPISKSMVYCSLGYELDLDRLCAEYHTISDEYIPSLFPAVWITLPFARFSCFSNGQLNITHIKNLETDIPKIKEALPMFEPFRKTT